MDESWQQVGSGYQQGAGGNYQHQGAGEREEEDPTTSSALVYNDIADSWEDIGTAAPENRENEAYDDGSAAGYGYLMQDAITLYESDMFLSCDGHGTIYVYQGNSESPLFYFAADGLKQTSKVWKFLQEKSINPSSGEKSFTKCGARVGGELKRLKKQFERSRKK